MERTSGISRQTVQTGRLVFLPFFLRMQRAPLLKDRKTLVCVTVPRQRKRFGIGNSTIGVSRLELQRAMLAFSASFGRRANNSG